MIEKAKTFLKDYEKNHSTFQIDNFIIGKQGDRWAQYKQCLQEIYSHVESIKNSKMNLKVMSLEKPRFSFYLPTKLNRAKRLHAKEILKARISKAQESISVMEKELGRFLEIAKRLKNKIGPITDERRQQLELESWTAKGRKMAAIDRVLTGRISHQTFEFILSLPIESQDSILDKILPNDIDRKLLIEDLRDAR